MNQALAPERYRSRISIVGEDTRVARALPHRARRTVGAWCFLDHAGPVQFAPGKGMHVGAHPHIGLQTFTWMIEAKWCTATRWATSRSSAPARST
jgi:redox-sensitive bicupin YhaK (pirin superfamily)